MALIIVWFWGILLGYTALFPTDPLFGFIRVASNWSRTEWISISQLPGLRLLFGLCSILLFALSIALYQKFKKEEKKHS